MGTHKAEFNQSNVSGAATRWLLAVAASAALAACGGGGGSSGGSVPSGSSGSGSETPQDSGGSPVAIDALPAGTAALRVLVNDSMATADQQRSLFGGATVAGWNIRDPQLAMVPGMKVAFFGVSEECDAKAANGPVAQGGDTEFAAARALTGIEAGPAETLSRWTPSGATTACNAAAQSLTGPNWAFLNPSASNGGMGIYTQVGPGSNGQQSFLQATSSSGIDGDGYNANGLANFIAFRQAWNSTAAIRPWGNVASQPAEARVLSVQTMGSADVGANNGPTVQVKQQVMVSLINTECQKGVQRPCQIQYLFNTAAVRTGVTDWESRSPSGEGWIWFDAAQSGLPIVAGMVPSKGGAVADRDTGLALYRSAGAATQHGVFSNQPFDLRISFNELLNAARIIAAARLNIPAAQVTDEQMSTLWSVQWNNPAYWTLVSSTFGHEIYNDTAATRHSHIGGGFNTLYVGPAQ